MSQRTSGPILKGRLWVPTYLAASGEGEQKMKREGQGNGETDILNKTEIR